jgi:ectoine hydroxylase-related dioxygenase (phytanoyl-CoA dioxygenase family)
MPLSQAQRLFYEENGFVVVPGVLSPDVLARVRDAITEITAEAEAGRLNRATGVIVEPGGAGGAGAGGGVGKPPLRKLNQLVPNDPFFRSVAASPHILDMAAQLIGNPRHIMLYSDQVFLKPAVCGSAKPLHQDNSYFRVTPHDFGVTCWIAVDDATIENGCLRYIPASHKLGLLRHKSLDDTHLTPEADNIGEEIPVPIPAGSAIFHHLLALHSSAPNTSAKSRRAWALHLCNRDAQSPLKPWEEMIQLR